MDDAGVGRDLSRGRLRGLKDVDADAVEASLISVADQLEARGRRKGREEGREQGREEGREEGRRETLAALAAILRHSLEEKFGEIPARLQARIAEADLELLARWTTRVSGATSLEDVFRD